MLNQRAEWFGHIAVQLALCTAFLTFEQTSSGFDTGVSAPPVAIHTLSRPPAATALAPKGAARQSPLNPAASAAAPALLAQLATNSPPPAPVTKQRQPVNETSTLAAGAKPSGKSVKPARFHPRVQSADDPTDPYIVAEAALLGNDPNEIFAFVRDQVAFNVYSGSLRGARGTLWSIAGNSLDKASLLIALLGAAGISAQYVEGTISPSRQQQLILSMFPTVSQVIGCPPVNLPVANPATDPTLLSEVGDHFWVEFGPGNTPADPNFPNNPIGTAIGTPVNTFTTIPSALQHTVTFRLEIEQYNQASVDFGAGDGLSTTEVLNQTFATTDLVGQPVTVGNFVSGSAAGALFSITTFTYSPYLRIGSVLTNPNGDMVISGQNYQEIYTNFPFGTEVLTGAFVNIDVNDPGAPTQTFERTLVDRIGYAARQGGASVQLQLPATPAPAVQPFQLQTYLISPSNLAGSLYSTLLGVAGAQDAAATAAATQAQGINPNSTNPADQASLQQLEETGTLQLITQQRLALLSLVPASADLSTRLGTTMMVSSYENSPRILDASSQGTQDTNGNVTGVQIELDLRDDAVQAVAYPSQQTSATMAFQAARGFLESSLEDQLAQSLMATFPSGGGTVASSGFSIVNAAMAQGIPLLQVNAANFYELNPVNIPADAEARITAAIQSGETVLAPASQPTVSGQLAYAWLEFNPTTGAVVDTVTDGSHQGISEFAAALGITGIVLASLATGWDIVAKILNGNITGNPSALEPDAIAAGVALAGGALIGGAALALFAAAILLGILIGLLVLLPNANPSLTAPQQEKIKNAVAKLLASMPGVPTLPQPLGSILVNLNGVVTPLMGTAPASSIVSLSGNFLLAFNGLDLPLVFGDSILNGPSATTYNIQTTSPSGFSAIPSVSQLTIPASQTGQAGVCLEPTGQLPAPGTPENFSVTATSASNPSVTTTANGTFTVPAIQAVALSATPISTTATPGQPFAVTLQTQSVGNVAANATLSATSTPGLAVSGLNGTVTLAAGQSSTQTLMLTPSSSTPVGTLLSTTITSSSGAGSNPQTASVTINVTVSAAQAESAAAGAASASTLGRTDIGTTLSGLSAAIDTALSSCGTASQQGVVDYVSNLIQEMNAPFLANFVATFQADAAAISAATCSNIGAALTQLSNDLASLNTVLQSPAAFPFNLTLVPNSATAIPTQGSQFYIGLQNNSTTTNTYALSLGSLPSGVTGSLSTPSVTLGPGQSIPVPNAMNNPSVTITPSTSTAFQFSVSASINGVSGSSQTAYGTMTARNTFLAIEDVTATPGFVSSGGSVDVTTHIANVVNQNKTVQVQLVVNNSSNTQVLGPFNQTVALSVTSLLTAVDFGQIATTGLANGNYTLAVSVIDPATNTVIPGGTGMGNLLIGSPVTATLTATPTALAPGNGTVTSTLSVMGPAGPGGGSSVTLIGSIATPSAAESAAVNGNYAYVCDNNEVAVVNITTPASLSIAGTVDSSNIANSGDIYCSIQSGNLVAFADESSSDFGDNPSFVAFSLANPQQPALIAGSTINKRFFSLPFYSNGVAFVPTNLIVIGSSIIDQYGDFVAVNVSNQSAPSIIGTLEQPQDPVAGGQYFITNATQVNATTAYLGSTTNDFSNTHSGVGQVWAVDITDPTNMSILTQVNVPGTQYMNAPLVQGNTGVAIGNTGGLSDPYVTDFVGNIVVATFDTTNPQSPSLLTTVTLPNVQPYGAGSSFGQYIASAVIGPNLFLFAGASDLSGNPLLVEVNTSNPASPVISTISVPAIPTSLLPVGNELFITSSAGLQIFSIPGPGVVEYTATVQVPNTGKVIYNPSSFSIAPTITPGTGFDTLTFTNPASNTITWTSNVTGISPADVLPVALGGTVNFTVTAGSGSITLPQVNINSGQIIGLNPGTQTVAPGQLASYTLIVNNPTSAAVTYNLAATGVNPSWVTLQPSVTVPANGSTNVPLTLRSTLADLAGTYNFMVTATSGGASGAVEGTMILVGTGSIGSLGSTNALGASVLLTPTQQTGGQGTPATFTVQVTNAGNVADTYTLSATTPGGVTATFSQPTLTIQPGLGNFQQTLLQLTAAPGTPPGPLNFTVTATSQTNSQIANTASGILNVISTGVAVSLSPPSVSPGGMFQLTVRNTGQTAGTFAIALGGPASVIATLASSSVTLAAGQSQNISVAIGSAPFAALGSLGLVATASANGVTGAADRDSSHPVEPERFGGVQSGAHGVERSRPRDPAATGAERGHHAGYLYGHHRFDHRTGRAGEHCRHHRAECADHFAVYPSGRDAGRTGGECDAYGQ